MTSQKKTALALALCAALVGADNCGTWSKGTGDDKLSYATHMFKETDVLKNLKCTSHTNNFASCANCCKTKDICHNFAVVCGAGKVQDADKASKATTSSSKDVDCCTTEAECKSHSCGTGWKKSTTKEAVKCAAKTCSNIQCCDLNDETCAGQMAAGNKCDNEDEYEYDTTQAGTALTTAQMGMYTNTCCKKRQTCEGQKTLATGCGANQFYDQKNLKSAAVVDVANWKTTCCKDKPTANKCKGFACNGAIGWLADTSKDTVDCWQTVDGVTSSTCTDAQCCKPDPEKCRGVTGTCGADKVDASSLDSKGGLVVANADEYATKCCLPVSTCTEAKALKLEGEASGSPHQHEPVMVLAIIGALALRM